MTASMAARSCSRGEKGKGCSDASAQRSRKSAVMHLRVSISGSSTCASDEAGKWQAMLVVLSESRVGILAAVAAGFGRVISEVGSVIMLGGNIAGETRTITTAIALDISKGEFGRSAVLALILLAVALFVNAIVHRALSAKK